jgi:hypothetical protein
MYDFLIPITLFVCVTMAIKIVMDARLRSRFAETNVSDELIKNMLRADEQARRLSALKWGLVLTLEGLAFGMIDWLHVERDSPGAIGLIVGAAGVGMLAYHAIAQLRD